MKIAVTYSNGEIFQHFGQSKEFKVYQVENGKIIFTEVITATEGGHSELAVLLQKNNIDALICGGIGGGAQTALAELGIKLYGAVSGNADKAVNDLLNNILVFNSSVKCNHFDSHHAGEQEHHCHGANGCKH